MGETPSSNLVSRTGAALAAALRHGRSSWADAPSRQQQPADLLLEGLYDEQLPISFDRARLRSPDSAAALAVNTFLPWQHDARELPLAGWGGFEAIQLEVRCPTGLRGTPPHLDLLALRDEVAVAVTVRCSEYLSQRKVAVAESYDRLLAETPGVEPWRSLLALARRRASSFAHVDVGALVKFALALGRTFPDRPTILHYLYWEPLDAERFEAFRAHRAELARVEDAIASARVGFRPEAFTALWQDWGARRSPVWLPDHVARLKARYGVKLEPAGLV